MKRSLRGKKTQRVGAIMLVIALCFSFFPSGLTFAQTTDTAGQQAQLESELTNINQEISGLNTTITGLKTEGVSLDRDIKLLSANIDKANLNIKSKNLQILRLGSGIADKQQTVKELSAKMERERQSLVQLIRKTNELDQSTLPELILSGDNLSNFFLDLDSFDAIRAGLKSSADALHSAKDETQAAQDALEQKQQQEMDNKVDLERNKQIVQANEKQKQQLLSITKNKEKTYSGIL